MVKITELSEKEIEEIGEAFADHVYADGERGMGFLFGSRDNVKEYICGYARAMIKGGYLYSTSENHEAFVAYRYSGEKMSSAAGMGVMKALLKTIGLGGAIKMLKAMNSGGKSYEDIFKNQKAVHIRGNAGGTQEIPGTGLHAESARHRIRGRKEKALPRASRYGRSAEA